MYNGNLLADKQTFTIILQTETAVLQLGMRSLVTKCGTVDM